jgi:hypothetical protein
MHGMDGGVCLCLCLCLCLSDVSTLPEDEFSSRVETKPKPKSTYYLEGFMIHFRWWLHTSQVLPKVCPLSLLFSSVLILMIWYQGGPELILHFNSQMRLSYGYSAQCPLFPIFKVLHLNILGRKFDSYRSAICLPAKHRKSTLISYHWNKSGIRPRFL